jgi:hypothetical protein
MIPVIDKPSDDTLEKIDFVIQGLENGQFEDLAKKIDFHQKLKGEDAKRFIKTLLEVIEAQSWEITQLRTDLENQTNHGSTLEARVCQLEEKLHDYTRNMRGIANGLIKLSMPDPLNVNNNYINVADAETFINDYKNKY